MPSHTNASASASPLNPLRRVQNRSLLESVWLESTGQPESAVFTVENPATGLPLASVANQTPQHAQHCLQTLASGQQEWSATHPEKRSSLLRLWFELIQDNIDDLALILTLEQGKPLAEARGEVQYAGSFVQWYAEEAKRIKGQLLHGANASHRALVMQQPAGVCASITPWNFPSAMVTRKIAPALAAGCTAALKPADLTPLSALALAQLAYQAGIPRNAFTVITGTDASGIGKVFCASPVVRHISFTGSTATGRTLLQQCAPTIKKTSLELGGNAPFIVFDDANVEAAVTGLMQCKFRNAGQVCVAANRIYVQNTIHDDFVSRLRKRVQLLTMGNGLDADVQLGPLITPAAVHKIRTLTADALRRGAQNLLGEKTAAQNPKPDNSALGKQHNHAARNGSMETQNADSNCFCPPVLLTGITPDMQLVQQEIFGPVIAIQSFDTEEQAVRLANSTDYGLAAYFYTQNIARLHRVSEALQCGMVGVNTGSVSSAHTPFGGTGQSGLGREGGTWGLEEYLETKYVNLGGLS